MTESSNPIVFLQITGALIGGLAGLISIGLVVFYGGALAEKVRAIDVRLVEVETHAAPITREHIRVDDLRDADLAARITRLEETRQAINQVVSDLRINGFKLDEVVKTTDRMEKAIEILQTKARP